MTRLRLDVSYRDVMLGGMILWFDAEQFLTDLTQGIDTDIEISTRCIKGGIRLQMTEKVADCPNSHIWVTDDDREVTLCDARMGELFPGSTTVWVRVAK